jgi:TatD-related deoxyribonuclease
MCKGLDCCAVLHTDSPKGNPALMPHLARLCDEARFPRKRAVKHYSGGDMADPALNMGLTPSILSTKDNMIKAVSKGSLFLMETDYIDEPSRPNVVLPPDTVPKKIRWMREKGMIDDEMQHRLMVDLPASALGLEVSL